MKLNLLPTSVSKGALAKTARVVMVLLIVLSIIACLGMIYLSNKSLSEAKDRAATLKPLAEEAVAISKQADEIVASSAGVMRNLELASAMDKHNRKFTAFYRRVTPYIPSFYRINSLSVTPIDDKSCTLNMDGVLHTYQQYADLMLALLRIPGARSVTRNGFVLTDKVVPNLVETDQRAEPIRPDEGRLPIDPLDRLDALIARASAATTGFTATGNFGTTGDLPRQAMPDWSAVTVSVLLETDPTLPPGAGINFDLRAPVPRTTLSAAISTAPVAATPAGGPPVMGGRPTGPPAGVPGGAMNPMGRPGGGRPTD